MPKEKEIAGKTDTPNSSNLFVKYENLCITYFEILFSSLKKLTLNFVFWIKIRSEQHQVKYYKENTLSLNQYWLMT